MLENLTSEKLSKYPRKLWILFTLGFTALVISVLIPNISEMASGILLGLFFLLMFICILLIRFGSVCKKCGNKVKHEKLEIPYQGIANIFERYNIKKPTGYSLMLTSQESWTFIVHTCEKCHYHQVITACPNDSYYAP